MEMQKIFLGKTSLQISPLGIGTWAWGDKFFWDYGHGYGEHDLEQAFRISVAAGVNFFDTAEAYGMGRSERILGRLVAEDKSLVVATKFFPYPWRWRGKDLLRALRSSLARLKMSQVHLYQLHWPFPPVSIETWAEALAWAAESGQTLAVGVSNYNREQMLRAYEVLQRHNLPLASNQLPYHLLDRRVEFNGLLKTCQELGVTLIAYSPLAQGMLSGKYTWQNPPPGVRGRRYSRSYLRKIQPLIEGLKQIGEALGGKTPAQVALNWVMAKGAVPIPGAKNAQQAQENIGALGWRLDEAQVAMFDQLSTQVHR